MNIVVTGGEGFIGKYVQARCAELGIDAIPYDISDGFDILNYSRLEEFVHEEQADAIIHLAGALGTHELWDTTDKAIDVNIKGALNVGRAAHSRSARLVSIEQPHIWYNMYEATKFAAKRMLIGMHYDQGLSVEFVTAHNAYGPGQHHGEGHPQKIVPTFASKAWAGEPIPIWGDGKQMVNLVYAGDVADKLVERAITQAPPRPHKEYHAGVDRLHSVLFLAEIINNYTVNDAGVEFLEMRRGEQGVGYPTPNKQYQYKFSYEKLYATVDSYRP